MAKTLLIIEDDGNIRELLRLYLEQEGYTVESCLLYTSDAADD